MFRKILVANRGEIALRVIRTCKRLGVETAAVYSTPDVESKHVTFADEAYELGPGEPSESYLNIGRILKAARKSHCEALHPGYGFLAESPDLALACEEEDVVFIGPSARVLGKVANKLESKRVVAKAGIPVIPGADKEVKTIEEAVLEARRIGFPVLVKAVYGGGGRGLRVARNTGELRRMVETARSEARTGFGRSELYLEKYLDSPRHIEVQILAGRRGRVVHLGERECSLQRRYQKIMEETPSPVLSEDARRRLVELAVKVARVTSYENAGTVEFVRSKQGQFYYLETNKRIQVEHNITEQVTGVDIVEEQLRMASGDGLNLSQSEVSFTGAAINCRINAEDPTRGFTPTPGRVSSFDAPGGSGIRVDTALYDGCPVPEFYDSLIAKIAAWGRNRAEAIARMRIALDETAVVGVKTTIPVHQMILEEESFRKGNYHTQFLDNRLAKWRPKTGVGRQEVAGVYASIARGELRAQMRIDPGFDRTSRSTWRRALQDRPRPVKEPLFVEGL